ncbi:DPP IV N-terminal domain-containing protein [Kordiimonas sp. SCSIO 12610]|uniref:TolB family protein n=1 Tax=Kordiimonas sp. SCSIO 12610 TaxID=2829597 RepID=UPI00210CB629|nr:DPP IV N-terminal domain-containing protein [Kordiimonas sp. SCSIO 12610]UTW56693.1 PD40 domain-containing protein [Kordiimonas sp. SCSIO 12610]
MKKLMIIFAFFMVAAFQGVMDHTLITNSPLEERTPALSPDGSKLAFLRSGNNDRDLQLVIYDFKTMRQHVPNSSIAVNSPPVWYADNQKLLASVKQVDGSYKLATIDSESGDVSLPLYTNGLPDGDQLFPDISPDGTKIAFSVLKPANFLAGPRPDFDIFVADTKTNDITAIVTTQYRDMWPRFDHEGSGLYFFSRHGSKGENDHIYHVDIRTKKIRNIIKSNGNDFVPSLSPDGHKLAFASNRSGEAAIYIHDLISGETKRLTKPGTAASHPIWHMGGSQIIFTARSSNGGRGNIAIIPEKLLHLLDK